MDKRLSFGVVRSEQTRLRGFGGMAGAVGFISFLGDSVSVQRRFGEEIERLSCEQKLVLRGWQAASVALHGGCSFATNRRGKRWGTCRGGQSNCRCETVRTDVAKAGVSDSNGSQAATTAPSRCAAVCFETESKPTCRQLGTIPKSAESRCRACPKLALSKVPDFGNGVENQSDAIALN